MPNHKTKWYLEVFFLILNHTPKPIVSFLNVVFEIIGFWWYDVIIRIFRPKSRVLYKQKIEALNKSTSLEDWIFNANEVDKLTGADLWRINFTSKRYDFESVLDQYTAISEAFDKTGDFQTLEHIFTTSSPLMLRNYAGIGDKRLFSKSLLGTKVLIEQYLNKILEILDFFEKNDLSNYGIKNSFYHRCKLSLGTTALILQGGSLFGLYHLGVIKALSINQCLPRIISGSSMGACIAALCCCLEPKKALNIFDADVLVKLIRDDVDLLKECGYGTLDDDLNIGSLIQNIVYKGYSKDVYLVYRFIIKHIVKELTFDESFSVSGRVLNIVVHPDDKGACPNLLNYVTTPNVLISSAIECSLGTEAIPSAKLLCKNIDGEIVEYISGVKVEFYTPQQDIEMLNKTRSPYTRLTELFNVNNFIISLARPYLAPLVTNDLKHEIKTTKYYYYKNQQNHENNSISGKINANTDIHGNTKLTSAENMLVMNGNLEQEDELLAIKMKYHVEKKLKQVLTMELRHRVEVLDMLGLLSPWIKKLTIDEKTPKSATEVTIVPQTNDISVTRIIEGRLDNIPHWILCGERSCWPVLALIKTRCSIEFKLDEIIQLRYEQQIANINARNLYKLT
ncbi:related to Lipase 3 [Saccharomycodes ludwigii]|uniref:Related to Lipase 3 n=1 Tax=Saccharomycodes ludwigii TaxID=36035 RepID=A0A376B7P0_9ASCO|nr:hypothetical protein SCDLUD_004434 [Saccharomycodes ludwigii]KAH3899013.1 hypothetical protein SCDLUD_004434 [Saccharomycodes ludwigii]SSD60662.1 related to Lipase 3 [Saccharomycodes ludwigii]